MTNVHIELLNVNYYSNIIGWMDEIETVSGIEANTVPCDSMDDSISDI